MLPSEISRPLPKGPVLGWSSFQRESSPDIPSVEDLPYIAYTTSGRAAIYHALVQMQLPPGSTVLVPTYHCPTMVAPVLLAGHRPAYFGVRADGLPDLQGIDSETGQQARAMLVSHYFGIAQSLQEVRTWCDTRRIVLIEDCAHSYFGQAGERPVGAWGDYCTASVSKFFPVSEAGLLGSAYGPLGSLALLGQGVKAQVKGWVDVIEIATKYQRLNGLNRLLASIFSLRQGKPARLNPRDTSAPDGANEMMDTCDMARIHHRPLVASILLRRILPRGRIIAQRQRNFGIYAQMLSNLTGARPLAVMPTQPVAPYVFPLWVDDADRIYHLLRAEGAPVFRWDRIWPGTPHLANDVGMRWSRHVLQLLCHQDLNEADIRRSVGRVITLLKSTPPATNNTLYQ